MHLLLLLYWNKMFFYPFKCTIQYILAFNSSISGFLGYIHITIANIAAINVTVQISVWILLLVIHLVMELLNQPVLMFESTSSVFRIFGEPLVLHIYIYTFTIYIHTDDSSIFQSFHIFLPTFIFGF